MIPLTPRSVVLEFSRPEIAELLAMRLRPALGDSCNVVIDDLDEAPADAVVVADDHVLSPVQCLQLAASGRVPVVLAAFPSEAAETVYRQAGARHYLGMMVDIAPLVAVLTGLL